MGYLTTFTVYNDGLHLVKDHPTEFSNKLYQHASESRSNTDFGLGSFCNLVKVQKCRHADDHTIYVHMGNTLVEMNSFSEETKNTMKQNPKFFLKLINHIEDELNELKKMYKLCSFIKR